MITPEEIFKKADRKYFGYLQSKLKGENIFPLEIPANKIPSNNTFDYSNEIKNLFNHSKEKKGFGYHIIYVKKRKKGLGLQSFPSKFLFEKESDFLLFLKKQKLTESFLSMSEHTFSVLPQLKDVIIKKPKILINNLDKWKDLLKVCLYFQSNPKPDLYIRQLPIKVHTKFIEQNKAVLNLLLQIILKPVKVNDKEIFEESFGLKYAYPLIRFRILDKKISHKYFSRISDLAIPTHDFKNLDLDINNIIIVENKTSLYTALSINHASKTMIIFGKGFGVSSLKDIEWIKNKNLFYWGDIDAQGFEILSQVRGYYPQTCSIMMDQETFDKYYQGDYGTDSKVDELEYLNKQENILYKSVLKNNYRLEQEKIPYEYSSIMISKAIST